MQQLSAPLPEQKVFWWWFGAFLTNSSCFCCWGTTLWAGNPLLRPKSLPLYYLTKMEGLIAGIITTGGPVSAASGFWGDFVFCWHVQAAFCGQRASLWAVNPLSSPKNPTDDHLLKTECMITYVTAHWSPTIAESDFLGSIQTFYDHYRSLLWSGSHFMMLKSPTWALKPLLRSI